MADEKTSKSTSTSTQAKTSNKEQDSKEPTTETEVKQASATGGVENTGPVSAGPSQDDLNPAFAPPKEDEDDDDK